MPRLNAQGEYAMGVGGHQGSVNGVYVPDSYGPYWVNDDEVIFGQPSDLVIKIMNVNNAQRRDASPNHPYNDIRAGGNNWAAWVNIPGLGLFAPNLHLPDAGLLDVGPDGAIGFRTLYHSNFGVEVFELSSERWPLNNTDVVYDLQLLGQKRAIWKNLADHRIRTSGIPQCVQVGNAFRPRAAFINNEWWCCYFSDSAGLVLHPFNSTIGYVIVPPGIDAWGHDMITHGNVLKIVWSTTAGELPEHYRERLINPLVDPRHELAPQVVIPAIGKPCWLCWFEFVNDLAYIPPGNSYMWVKAGGIITRVDRTQFAQWVQIDPSNPSTDNVEYIEQKCQESPWPCVAYWDSRIWPRLPNIKPNDWTAIQCYCRVTETPQRFEQDLRQYINSLPFDRKYCLVCQCYTDNNSLTKDIIGLVPVFARLARDYNQINFLMPFNDQGRGNAQVGGGLQWNPQVKPYWEQLAAGITGVPSMGNGIENGIVVNPREFFFSLVEGKDPNNYQAVMREIQGELYKYGFGHFCNSGCEPRGRIALPTAICPTAAARPNHPNEDCLGIRQESTCWEGEGRYANVVQDQPKAWIWDEHGGPAYQPFQPQGNPQLPQDVCEAVNRERAKYGASPNDVELAQILNDAAWSVGQGADIGVSRKDSGAHANSPERPGLGNIARDIIHRKSDNMIWDVLIAAGDGGPATPSCGEALGEMTDPNRPWVAPVQPPDVPAVGGIIIMYHDPVCRRSDPNGCLIRFDVSSPHPVVEVEAELEGDGEPSLLVRFTDQVARDGRYVRGLAFKFTVNGVWVLRMKARDNQGNTYQSDGTHLVEVTF